MTTPEPVNQILLGIDILALTLAAIFALSPSGCEWLGRVITAYSKALREYRTLKQQARQAFYRVYQEDMDRSAEQ